jgi:DNA polymerase-3 subunit epsilon
MSITAWAYGNAGAVWWRGDAAMFKNLVLGKPLAIIDLETTGTDPQSDRIVEIGILKVTPDSRRCQRVLRLNPGIPIPPGATAVHGITDADVAGGLSVATARATSRIGGPSQ